MTIDHTVREFIESANLPTSRAVTMLIGFFRSWLHWRDYFGTTAHRCAIVVPVLNPAIILCIEGFGIRLPCFSFVCFHAIKVSKNTYFATTVFQIYVSD
jgi:hypothetical protein